MGEYDGLNSASSASASASPVFFFLASSSSCTLRVLCRRAALDPTALPPPSEALGDFYNVSAPCPSANVTKGVKLLSHGKRPASHTCTYMRRASTLRIVLLAMSYQSTASNSPSECLYAAATTAHLRTDILRLLHRTARQALCFPPTPPEWQLEHVCWPADRRRA